MINKIYLEILDFVFLVKKLEYTIRENYSYKGESIFRGSRIEKLIPMKGEIVFENIVFKDFFSNWKTCGCAAHLFRLIF